MNSDRTSESTRRPSSGLRFQLGNRYVPSARHRARRRLDLNQTRVRWRDPWRTKARRVSQDAAFIRPGDEGRDLRIVTEEVCRRCLRGGASRTRHAEESLGQGQQVLGRAPAPEWSATSRTRHALTESWSRRRGVWEHDPSRASFNRLWPGSPRQTEEEPSWAHQARERVSATRHASDAVTPFQGTTRGCHAWMPRTIASRRFAVVLEAGEDTGRKIVAARAHGPAPHLRRAPNGMTP